MLYSPIHVSIGTRLFPPRRTALPLHRAGLRRPDGLRQLLRLRQRRRHRDHPHSSFPYRPRRHRHYVHHVQRGRRPGGLGRRLSHRSRRRAPRQPDLLRLRGSRRRHGRLRAQPSRAVCRPRHLRHRLRNDDRCAKRHHRALVHRQGTGHGLRHHAHHRASRHSVFL